MSTEATSIVIVPTIVVPDTYGRFRMLLSSSGASPYVPFYFHFSQPSSKSVCRQLAAYLEYVLRPVVSGQINADQLYAQLTRPDSGPRMLTLSKMDDVGVDWLSKMDGQSAPTAAPGAVWYHAVIRLASEAEAALVLNAVVLPMPTGGSVDPQVAQSVRVTSASKPSSAPILTLSSPVDVLRSEDKLVTRLAAGVLVAQADWARDLSRFTEETSVRIRAAMSIMPAKGANVWGPIAKALHRPAAAVSAAAALGSDKVKALWKRVKHKSGYTTDEVTTVIGILERVRYRVETMKDLLTRSQILEDLAVMRRSLDSVASVSLSITQIQS